MFKLQTILILQYTKKNNPQTFQTSVKLIASDSNIHETFKSMHQSILRKNKNSASQDWMVIEIIVKYGITIFEC